MPDRRTTGSGCALRFSATSFTPDRWLADGVRVTLGQQEFKVSHCPGHTPGHVVFFHEAQRCVWVGDVSFEGSIGRKRQTNPFVADKLFG